MAVLGKCPVWFLVRLIAEYLQICGERIFLTEKHMGLQKLQMQQERFMQGTSSFLILRWIFLGDLEVIICDIQLGTVLFFSTN